MINLSKAPVLATFSFRNAILGATVIPSRTEHKRLMLTGYLSVICMAVALTYTILDFFNDVYYALPAYTVLFTAPALSVLLIRRKKYKLAKIILMISSNLVVFWSAVNDPFETGAFLFFIPTGIGSFALLGFEDRLTGLILVGFSAGLFMIAYFGDLHLVDAARPSAAYIQISFILNYVISLTIAVLAVYFLMSLNQISENDLMQKENFANQKNAELQKVNDELDRFVYSVSHDLRSPLSSILGLTNIARLSNDPDELNEIMKMIQGRVSAQDHFIREIIDYSRNARTEAAAEPVHLRQLVDEIIEALKFNHNADKIQFIRSVPNDLVITSDKIRLSIIFNNLIGNAIKYHDFSKQSPFVEIGVNLAPFSFYVKDNGLGVMPEHAEKIFNMFYRGSDHSTGSGLGLFITKEAIEKLGGSIALTSTHGEGSVFIVSLPAALPSHR